MLNNVIWLTGALLVISAVGYVLSVMKEKMDLFNDRIQIHSDKVTQRTIDQMELKAFRLGKVSLMIGDEVKVYLKDNAQIRGVVLGARKADNCLCMVTREDEVVELSVATIRKLKVLARYGRLW